MGIADVSRGKKLIVAVMKTKMQLVLGKKHLGNERIYTKWMSANFEPKWKPLTLKTSRKPIDFERSKTENVKFRLGGFSYAIQEKFTPWRVNST